MAPEILRGTDTYDKSADIYSFGMLLYDLVVGLNPFRKLFPRTLQRDDSLLLHSSPFCIWFSDKTGYYYREWRKARDP